MINVLRFAIPTLLVSTALTALADTIVPANTYVSAGQTVYSDSRKYFLAMQTDGNLVFYRNDGAVRWTTYRAGNYAVMQGDGNFVEYTSAKQPVWNSVTGGNPGAFLSVQNDGNLVVYSSRNVPLWSIGADISSASNPSNAGHVVGRDFGGSLGAPAGHVGLWDGGKVIEAQGYASGNTLRIISLSDFKSPGGYWGAAKANIPTNYNVLRCFQPHCTNFSVQPWGQVESVGTRTAIAKRAYQSYLIGADYTIGATFRAAWAGDYYNAPRRGLYRCDTFLIETFHVTTTSNSGLAPSNPPGYSSWYSFVNGLLSGVITPSTIYNKLANYK